MMMSMFSSFEALCAEALGHKFNNNKPDDDHSNNPINKGTGAGADTNQQQQQPPKTTRKMMVPRFAPELDGLLSSTHSLNPKLQTVPLSTTASKHEACPNTTKLPAEPHLVSPNTTPQIT
ncbi:hypothetical protein ACFE04_009012 [Oxalis oulophora]